jgi:hypothetical protein
MPDETDRAFHDLLSDRRVDPEIPLPELERQVHEGLQREAASGFTTPCRTNTIGDNHPVRRLIESPLNRVVRKTRHQDGLVPPDLNDHIMIFVDGVPLAAAGVRAECDPEQRGRRWEIGWVLSHPPLYPRSLEAVRGPSA